MLALIQASPKHPCPLHGDSSVSGRGHTRVRSSTSSLATTARERAACTVRCRSSALVRHVVPSSAAHDSIFKDEHPRLASPSHLAMRENLGSRRGSRFGALSPDARRLFTGRAVVRAAPLVSRRSSSTDFSDRRSRTKTASAEPPVTVRLDFHDPGYLPSRSHDGLRRLVIRALETQLTFRADPGVLSFGPGQYPRP